MLATAPAVFALVGHSLGAIVALEIARRAPGRVARLALLNASARPASGAQLEAWRAMRQRTEEGEFGAVAEEYARSCFPPTASEDLVARGTAMAQRVGPGALFGNCRHRRVDRTAALHSRRSGFR